MGRGTTRPHVLPLRAFGAHFGPFFNVLDPPVTKYELNIEHQLLICYFLVVAVCWWRISWWNDSIYVGYLWNGIYIRVFILETCEASRFDSNRPSDLIWIGRFENFRIESAVLAPLLVVSLVKRLKPLTALSGTVYRLASSVSDHTPVV